MLVLVFALAFFFASERMGLFTQSDEQGPKVVSFWAFSVPAQTMTEIKGQFEEKYPDLRVEVQTVPWKSMQEKTLWAIAAQSNVPDVIVASSEWMGGLAENGALEPLDGMQFDTAFFDTFVTGTLGTYQFPEVRRDQPGKHGKVRQYGVPVDLDMMLMFYRTDILNPIITELGMKSFPESWADFERLGKEVKKLPRTANGEVRLLYLDPEDPVPVRMAFLPASGARFLDTDFKHAIFDRPEGVEAFQFFQRLLDSGSALRWTRSTSDDPIVLYKNGQALANIAGPWYSKFLETKAPEQAGKWGVALFPRRTPEVWSCGLGGSCLAMPYNAPNKDAARKLIAFMSSPEFALKYFQGTGSPPPLKALWNNPLFDEPAPYFGGQKIYQVAKQAIESGRPLSLVPNPEVIKGPFHWAMYETGVKSADPKVTLAKAAKWANTILEQN